MSGALILPKSKFWLGIVPINLIHILMNLKIAPHDLVLMFDAVPFIILLEVRRSRVSDVPLLGEDVRNMCSCYE